MASPPKNKLAHAGNLQQLGKYHIERTLGAGGMGTVYLATDTALNRTVALKVLPRERAENPILVRRFKSEGQAAAVLEHRNIIRVYDAGEADGYLYLALEFVDGVDVLEWMRKRGIIPIKRSLDIIRQVTEALVHASQKNIVHRDIKPSNLMIARDGTVKLADMGLARSVDDTLDTSITRDGTTVGTVDYMSPEQAANSKSADIRSDIYSLGCTWYHMLTGSPPFSEGSVTAKLTAHAKSPPPDPRIKNERVTEAMVAVLHRMMAKKPQDRYQTAEDLLEDLNNDVLLRGGSPAGLLAMLTEEDSHYDLKHRAGAGKGGAVEAEDVDVDWDADDEYYSDEEEPYDESPGSPVEGSAPKSAKSKRPQAGKPGKYKKRAKPSDIMAGDIDRPNQPARQGEVVETTTEPGQRRRKKGRQTSAEQKAGVITGNKKGRKPIPAREEPVESSAPGAAKSGTQVNIDIQQIGLVVCTLLLVVGAVWWGIDYIGKAAAVNTVASNPPPAAEMGVPDQAVGVKPNDVPLELNVRPQEKEPEPEPTTTQSATITRFDFPGADHLGKDPAQLRALLPEWLLSGWGMPSLAGSAKMEVARGHENKNNKFSSLDAALAKLSAQGGTIELQSTSIQNSRAITLKGNRHLIIKAAEDAEPVIMIDGSQLSPEGVWLDVPRGIVELDGLHFVVNRTQNCPADRLQLLKLRAANVIVRDCTFTVLDDSKPVDVMHVTERSTEGNRVLLEGTLIRGNNVTALRLSSPACDVVAGDCLLASRQGTLISIDPAADDVKSTDQRTIRLLGTTLLGQAAIQATHAVNQETLPTFHLELHRSLILAASTSMGHALSFVTWPVNAEAGLNAARPAHVQLGMTHTRFIGWQNLTTMTDTSGETHTADDETGWRQFWRQPLPSDDLMPPVDSLASLDIVNMTPAALSETLGDIAHPGVGARAQIGCRADHVAHLPDGFLERFQIAAQRPRVPADIGATASEPIRFDLKRIVGLQKFIDSPECPDGAHVICFGSGLKILPTLTINKRHLTLEFEQSDGSPLLLQPDSSDEAEAAISVSQGELELVNLSLTIPEAGRRRYPATFLKVDSQASFSLRNCHIVGPPTISQGVPLIDCADVQGEQRYGTISATALLAKGPVVRLDMSKRVIEVDNSLLVSNDVVWMMSGGTAPGSLLIHRSTLSGTSAIVHYTGAPETSPVDLFIKETVFAPPVQGNAQTALLVVDDERVVDSGLRWWESASGFAAQIPVMIRAGQSVAVESTGDAWEERWGSGHSINSIFGQRSILLQKVLSGGWAELQPMHFALDSSCVAAHWADDGKALGANLEKVGPQPDEKETPDPKTTTPNSPPTRPTGPKRPPRPDF